MNPDKTDRWYEQWFNSPWYHRLYKHRSDEEAEQFIGALCRAIQPPAQARVLDLACGKGRHSIVLHKLGFDVTGVDLAEESIALAKQNEQQGLSFAVHDMREVFRAGYFDLVVNLFTSFGYFIKDEDNAKVIASVGEELKSGGLFVIDYLNAVKVRAAVAGNCSGVVNEGGACITWEKRIDGNMVVKEIVVSENGKLDYFNEMVKLYGIADFEKFMNGHFTIEQTFGDYSLSPFDAAVSDRLIIVARKK